MKRFAIALFAVIGCGGKGESSDTPDPPMVDAPDNLPACTGATFDPCTDNSQCMSNNCHFYMMSGIQVCTAACTPGDNTTCPVDVTGANGFCNNMGTCKPAAANACSR